MNYIDYVIAIVLGFAQMYCMARQVMYNIDGEVIYAFSNSLIISGCVYAQIHYAGKSLPMFITYSIGAALGQTYATWCRQVTLSKRG